MRKLDSIVFLLIFALLAACAGPGLEQASAPTPGGEAPAELVATSAPAAHSDAGPAVISFGDLGYRRASYQPLIDQFNRANPDIQVEFMSIEALTHNGASAALDTEAIVQRVDVATLASLSEADARRGLVLDLKGYIDGDASFDHRDFFPAALGTLDAGIYQLPAQLNLPLLQYNRDLWDAAGLPAPALDWSGDDFKAAIGKLAEQRGDQVQTYGYVSRAGAVALLLSEVERANAAGSIQLDSPEGAQALARAAGLAASGAVFVASESGGVGEFETMRELIRQGKAGIWEAQISPSELAPTFALGTAVVPRELAHQPVASEGYSISAGTLAPEAAWRWLSFLSRQGGKGPFASVRGPGAIPARRSVAEAGGYWQSLDNEAAAAVRSIVEQPPVAPNRLPFTLLYAPIQRALQAVLGGASPAAAAREAQHSLDQQLAQATAAAQAPTAPFVVGAPARPAPGEGIAHIIFSEPFSTGRFEQLVKQFNQQNADIVVELRAMPPTAGSTGLADLAAASDCFLWWSQPDPNDAPALLDLQPLLDADASFSREDYPPAVLAPYRQHSALYGLPIEVTFPVLAYNTVLFEHAGIQPPSANWTLDDLIDAAMRLTSGEGTTKQYGYSASGSASTRYFLYQAGASLTSGEGDSLRPNFTDPSVVQALRSYLGLLKLASPNEQLNDYARDGGMAPEIAALREQGRVGMWYQFGLSLGSFGLGGEQGFRPQVVPLPGITAQGAALFEGNSLHIAADTEHPQACWSWMTYLSGEPSATTYGIPARLSIAESSAFLSQAPAGTGEIVEWYRIQAATAAPQAPQTAGIELYWLNRAIDRALQGAALDRELDEAQQRTRDFLACVRTEHDQPACAKQVDPEYNGWQL